MVQTKEELIEQTVQEMLKNDPKIDPEKHRQMLKKIFIDEVPVAKALGLSEEFLEYIYAHAGNSFRSGRYDYASKLYQLLRIYDPNEPRFAMALAACYHRQKKYKEAADMYMFTYMLDPDNFVPLYHMSDCFIEMNQSEAAVAILTKVLMMIESKRDLKIIHERVLMTIESLKAKLSPSQAQAID